MWTLRIVLASALLGCGQSALSAGAENSGPADGEGSVDRSTDSGEPWVDGSARRDEGGSSDTPATPASDAAVATDAGSCGERAGTRGLTQRHLTVAGLNRTYLVYLPDGVSAAAPIPFVYVFHGYTMSGAQMHAMTEYAALADREHIAVVFPDGQGGADSLDYPWNIEGTGQSVCGGGQGVTAAGDDFAFMDAMTADVAHDQCLDGAHVFATGFSMGGYFSHHIACYRSDVRAAAPHSGGITADLSSCTTGHVPMIIFHGDSDSVIAAGCDSPTAAVEHGFPASASLWAQKNGCLPTYTTITVDADAGGKGQCFLYDGCPEDGQVELCTFAGMDHCWAGGTAAGSGGNACPTYASATELEWSFFKKYAW